MLRKMEDDRLCLPGLTSHHFVVKCFTWTVEYVVIIRCVFSFFFLLKTPFNLGKPLVHKVHRNKCF